MTPDTELSAPRQRAQVPGSRGAGGPGNRDRACRRQSRPSTSRRHPHATPAAAGRAPGHRQKATHRFSARAEGQKATSLHAVSAVHIALQPLSCCCRAMRVPGREPAARGFQTSVPCIEAQSKCAAGISGPISSTVAWMRRLPILTARYMARGSTAIANGILLGCWRAVAHVQHAGALHLKSLMGGQFQSLKAGGERMPSANPGDWSWVPGPGQTAVRLCISRCSLGVTTPTHTSALSYRSRRQPRGGEATFCRVSWTGPVIWALEKRHQNGKCRSPKSLHSARTTAAEASMPRRPESLPPCCRPFARLLLRWYRGIGPDGHAGESTLVILCRLQGRQRSLQGRALLAVPCAPMMRHA